VLPKEDISSLQIEADEGEQDEKEEAGSAIMQTMRWGLLPPHQKQLPTFKDTMNTINARDDTLLSGSPLWSRPFNKGQRCVVFVQGFYEWLKKTKGSGVERIPHFIGMEEKGVGRRDREGEEKKMMPLAGLWEKCRPDGESEERFTFTIITTDVSSQLDFLHDRQPLILPSEEAIATWLDPSAPLAEVRKLVKTFDGKLEFYKVPKEVGKVGNDNPSFLLPVEDRKDGLMAAFGRAQKSSKTETSEGSRDKKVAPDTNSETHAPAPQEGDVAGEDVHQGKIKEGAEEDKDHALLEVTQQEEEIEQAEAEEKEAPHDELLAATKAAESHDTRTSAANDVKSKEEGKDSSTAKPPSSRWSPDPWNPPVSPDRPNGGYSTLDEPHSGLSKYGSVKKEEGHGSPFKRKAPDVKMGDGALENSFKKQKVKKETEEELGLGAGAEGRHEISPSGQGLVSPPRPQGTGPQTTPSKKAAEDSKKRHTDSPKKRKGQGDIRSFFASP
jgi:putative SOS response-associated peptidase YedK